jgi:CRP/FNR family transcriptional regulator, cyclic AMP receptor protein
MIHTLEPTIWEHPFFKGLEERYIQFITGCAKNVRFREGDVIFREGDAADEFYVIRRGLVAVELMVPQRGYVTVQTVGEGDVLDWSWLLAPYRWHFDARALQATSTLAFDGKCLRDKCEENHDLGYELLKRFTHIMTERLDAMRLQLMDLYGIHG